MVRRINLSPGVKTVTHSDYEIASVKAAGAELRYRGEAKLTAVDARIAEVESTLVFLLHQRREIVNQYDLNKPAVCHHVPDQYEDGVPFCIDCGVRV